MRAMLVTCDYLVFALLYCNVVGMYTTGERSVGSCGCLPTKCSLFTITTDLLLAVVYIAVSCGFIGLLNKLIRQLMNTSTMSKSARRRQTSEIAKVRSLARRRSACSRRTATPAAGRVRCQHHLPAGPDRRARSQPCARNTAFHERARCSFSAHSRRVWCSRGAAAAASAHPGAAPTSPAAAPSLLTRLPLSLPLRQTLPFFFFLLISTGGIVGRTSTPSAVERTLERLGYNGVEIMAQAGARRAERAVTGRPHRGWLALDVSCTELIIEDRQLGIALPSLFHGKSFFVSLQVAPPPPGRGTQEQQGGAAEEASVYADSEGAEQHSPAVLDSQEWTEVSRSDVVEVRGWIRGPSVAAFCCLPNTHTPLHSTVCLPPPPPPLGHAEPRPPRVPLGAHAPAVPRRQFPPPRWSVPHAAPPPGGCARARIQPCSVHGAGHWAGPGADKRCGAARFGSGREAVHSTCTARNRPVSRCARPAAGRSGAAAACGATLGPLLRPGPPPARGSATPRCTQRHAERVSRPVAAWRTGRWRQSSHCDRRSAAGHRPYHGQRRRPQCHGAHRGGRPDRCGHRAQLLPPLRPGRGQHVRLHPRRRAARALPAPRHAAAPPGKRGSGAGQARPFPRRGRAVRGRRDRGPRSARRGGVRHHRHGRGAGTGGGGGAAGGMLRPPSVCRRTLPRGSDAG